MSYYSVEDTFQFLDKIPAGNLLEFGVFSGNTLNRLIKGAEAVGQSFVEVFGFDSFKGIPAETDGVLHNPEWPEGAFNICKDFNLAGVEHAKEFVRSRVERSSINLIDGYYEDSLTDSLGKVLKNTGSYLHIDVDLYKSSYEVLDWLFKHKIPKIGSIIRYDDWMWCKEGEAGNSLAHNQIKQKYRIGFNRLSLNVFQIIDY